MYRLDNNARGTVYHTEIINKTQHAIMGVYALLDIETLRLIFAQPTVVVTSLTSTRYEDNTVTSSRCE